MDWWDRLIGRWTLAEVPWVHHYELDPDVVLQVTEADRLGDLNPANAVVLPRLGAYATTDDFDRTLLGDALGYALRTALERRQWLWMGTAPTSSVPRIEQFFGPGIVQVAGPEVDDVVPVVVNPLRWVRHWARGTHREQEFVRRATAGTDTLTVSRHDLAALHEVGADVIERGRFLRALRNPKLIAYLVVLLYSALRALPVTFVREFHGKVWVLWTIDLVTAIPYTWGLIAMVTARTVPKRILGGVVAVVTFVLPYVYFGLNGRGYPAHVLGVITCMILAGVGMEVLRWQRDRLVARALRATAARQVS